MRPFVFILLLLPFTHGCNFDTSLYMDNDHISNAHGLVVDFERTCKSGSATLLNKNYLKNDEQLLQAVFKKVSKLNASLHLVESSWETLDLSSLSSIREGEKLVIQDNFNLKQIIIPSIFKCDGCELKIRGNPLLNPTDIKNLHVLVDRNNKINTNTASAPTKPMIADIQKHRECSAKYITELNDLEDCTYVYGDLVMEGPRFSGSLPKKYRLKAVDGCVIIDGTQITNSNFLFATRLNCYKEGDFKDNQLSYSYIGENAGMCGEHNDLIEDSLRRANPKTRISWQHNCEEVETKPPKVKEEKEILKWDVREEEKGDELSFVLIVIFFFMTLIAFLGPFVLSRITPNYNRSIDPYGPYGPLSADDRQVDKPFVGFREGFLEEDQPEDDSYTVTLNVPKDEEQ